MKLDSLSSKEIKYAELQVDATTKVMLSYGKPAAALLPGRGYVRTEEVVSKTTERHIAEWIGEAPFQSVPQSTLDSIVEGQTAWSPLGSLA